MRPLTCDDPANALLPWHVNGSLEGMEAALVRAHVEQCRACAQEVRELVEVAAAAPQASTGAAASRRMSNARRLAVAAAVLLPIVLGVAFWASRVPAPQPQLAVKLDLGAGPLRSAEALPRISIPPGAERVAVSLLLPVVLEGPLSIQLRGPSGKLLTEAPATPDCERGEGCTYTLPASLFNERGRYTVVFAKTGSPEEQGYSYPFTVGELDDR